MITTDYNSCEFRKYIEPNVEYLIASEYLIAAK